ncbi:alpha/beta hydrolase [Sphingomonas sp. R647]|uniref:alpha/beta hydrolase n=1 Tax=Sphingomonas sp. R647 TaxID=2875233 RepID=UPI001CD50308|nr:alpha/beta hydrolase [Sphingomonas sp. R647]MCA1196412.1 alpha/beta hydrolase [Sphingomonas sp. R647]
MHRVDVIHPDQEAGSGGAFLFARDWLLSQFDRPELASDGFWFESYDDPRFGPTIVIIGGPAAMQGILLNGSLIPLASGPDTLCVLRPDWDQIEKRLYGFASDFGMPPAVTRLVVALFQSGDVREAASRSGLAYETAREYLDVARGLVGAANLQNLITLLGLGIASTGSNAEESDALLAYAYGVSERQTQIAGLIANGAARQEVARMLSVSDALVKKELAQVFAAVDVENAAGLARAMVELRLLAIATNLHDARDPFPEAFHQDMVVTARDGRLIMASDYGPRSGKPVLVLHSSMTNRPANRALVEALQNNGYRPVAMDRPGFGDTHAAPEACRGQAYFDLAARDIADLCQARGWPSVRVVSRGAAQVVLALHRQHADLIDAAVIMNPDPDARSSSKSTGFLAAMKRNFARRPWAVAVMSHWAVQSLTFARVRANVMRSVAGCPADAQIMADPAHMRDYYRGVTAFRDGKLDGFIREQTALATVGMPPPLRGTTGVTLLVGDQDSIHDPHETVRYWRKVLPDAQIETVSGAGRFMSYSHPELVVKALARRAVLPRRDQGPRPPSPQMDTL